MQAPYLAFMLSVSQFYHLPPRVLPSIQLVEAGQPGTISHNFNGTGDLGVMQVNSTWVPAVAKHWRASQAATFGALRDNFCANVEAGTWILRQAMDEAHGDFWAGVGFYHSHDPGYRADYLRKVLHQTLRLKALAARDTRHPTSAGS